MSETEGARGGEPPPAWMRRGEPLPGGRGERSELLRAGRVATRAEVLAGWRDDAGFRAFFSRELARLPYPAFLWETPPWTSATLALPFAFVALESRALAAMPVDTRSFAGPMRAALARDPEALVCTCPNLGGDATLVLPIARASEPWPHLAAFVRTAPAATLQAFWRAVARAVDAHLGDTPLWLSTSGLGVAWLHARVDERPKYFQHAPYRRAP